MPSLATYPLRIRFDVETKSAIDSVSGSSTTSAWRGNDVTIAVAAFFEAAPLDVSNFASFTLQIKNAQNPTASPLAAITVNAVDIIGLITEAGWNDETEQNASFAFTAAQMNQTLSGNATRNFWLVLAGLTDAGKSITLGAATLILREDNAGSDDTPPTPADDYYTVDEIDALLALVQRGGSLDSSAAIRAIATASGATATGAWRAIDLSGSDFGFIKLTAGTDADAGTDDGPWRPTDYDSSTNARVWKRRL